VGGRKTLGPLKGRGKSTDGNPNNKKKKVSDKGWKGRKRECSAGRKALHIRGENLAG